MYKTVRLKELETSCWSPLRFFEKCSECVRYKKCDYTVKVKN